MHKGRLEAFSDGVIAILITIMVLELHQPEGHDLHALRPLLPVFLTYVLSFIYIGIYWNNHHHMLQATTRINGAILWANLHLLFWLSLVPFVTGWMGENHSAALPNAAYGTVMLCCAIAYTILAECHPGRAGQRLEAGPRRRQRPERLDVARTLCDGRPGRVREPVDLRRVVCDRGADLARA